MVFCAGKGTRLDPLTSTRPKHLLPIAGAPLIEHTMRALKDAGVSEALVVIHHMGDKIKGALGDGSRLGLKVEYADQGGVLGTGHALLMGRPYIGKEQFMVIYGDLAVDPRAIRGIVEAHDPNSFGTIAGVDSFETRDYGSLAIRDGLLEGIIEKPKGGGPGIINGGIYVLDPKIFDYVKGTGTSERGEVELTDSITNAISRGETVRVFQIKKAQWVDVGRPWNVLEANELLMERAVGGGFVAGSVDKAANLKGKVVVEEGAEILPGAYIEGPAWISAGCRVGPNCHIRPYTYLCRGVRVGNGCEIKASILMEGCHVGHLSYVGDSIIGEGANLGAGTITANLRFDGMPVRVRVKGVAVETGRRKLGAFLGDGVKTGINVSLFPGVKVGEQSWIGPHVALDSDIPARTLVTLRSSLMIRKRR